MKTILSKVLEYAQANKEGFTVNLETFGAITSGVAVAYQATQDSFGNEGLKKVLKHAQQNDKIIGGWFNTENGKFYWDSVRILKDVDEAIKFGKEQKQIAIFDIDNLEEIRL